MRARRGDLSARLIAAHATRRGPRLPGVSSTGATLADAALQGTLEDPSVFCARHGLSGSNLEARLDGLVGMIANRGASPVSTASAPLAIDAEPDLPWERLGG